MTLFTFTGLETGDSTELTLLAGTASISSAQAYTGTYSLRANPTTTGTGYGEIGGIAASGNSKVDNVGNVTPNVVGFRFYAATLPASGSEEIFAISNSAEAAQLTVRVTSAGKLQLYNADGTTQVGGDSTNSIGTGQWYRIEVYGEAGTAGTCDGKVYLDGNLEITTATGTFAGNTAAHDVALFGKITDRNGQSVDFYYDDMYRGDTQYFASEMRVAYLRVDGNGTYTAFTAGTNSSNYLEVDETVPDNATTYVQSAAANSASTFTLTSTTSAGISGTIRAATFHTYGARVGAGLTHDTRIRVNSTDYDYADTAWTSTANYFERLVLLEVSPNTSVAWTTSELDGAEVGTEETTGSTNRPRVTAVWASVLFTPAAATGHPTRRRLGGVPYVAFDTRAGERTW
jgi:hypothetical protein